MTDPKPSTSRRDFLKTTGQVAAASALAGVAVPAVHAGEDNTIRVALVGCGGRGTGAAANALATKGGPIKLVAMADVFREKLDLSFEALTEELGAIVEYAAQVSALDTSAVPPTAHPFPVVNVFRPDVARPGLPRDEVLAAAPEAQEKRFRVPRILGEEP